MSDSQETVLSDDGDGARTIDNAVEHCVASHDKLERHPRAGRLEPLHDLGHARDHLVLMELGPGIEPVAALTDGEQRFVPAALVDGLTPDVQELAGLLSRKHAPGLPHQVFPALDFAGKIESGLFKMMAIGLGKFAGAQRYHTYAYKLGLEQVIRSVGRQVLASGKILGGLAILEDAHHNTAQLTAVPVEVMEQREEELLALTKSWMGRIPMNLDILVLDEIGKNISGAGMDTKVVNRGVHGQYNPWPDAPIIERIFIRGLSNLSYGNGVGLGMADVVSDRLLDKIDWNPTRINSLTASTPAAIRTPVHFRTDRECLERFAPTVGKTDLRQVTYGWLRNSLELDVIALSENLRQQIDKNPILEVIAIHPMEFDSHGNLPDLLVPTGEPVAAH